MTDDIDASGELGAFLVTYRMAIYLGGIAVIGLPLVLHSAAGVTLPRSARLAITVAVVGLMTVTYLAERRLGTDVADGASGDVTDGAGGDGPDGPAATRSAYSLRTRITVAAAVLGLAAGVYVALEVSLPAGLLFVVGAYLFAYLAYRIDGGEP